MKLQLILLPLTLFFMCNGITSQTNADDESVQENCTTKIIKKDSLLGDIRNYASKDNSLSTTIENYAESVLSLNFENCPEEFKTAFHNHIEAWLEMRAVTDKHPALRGELHDAFGELEASKDSTEFKLRLKKIWETWEIVEKNVK